MHGFGALGADQLPGGVNPDAVDPTPAEDLATGLKDVHRIAEKYDGQPVEDITIFNLAAGTGTKIDFSQTPFSSIIVSVTTGTVKVMFGDYLNQARSAVTAHMLVPSGGAPFQPLMATLGRVITLLNDPAAASNAIGCLIISRP